MHGFDVFDTTGIDKKLIGSRVTFSGYLDEDHFFNDDVVKGKLEAVRMTAVEVKAEKIRMAVEKEDYEAAHPTCKTNWKVCANNSDFTDSGAWSEIVYVCQTASNKSARYGKPQWSWGPFSSHLSGDDYPKTGIITAIDEDVKFQNGFGVYGASRVVCVYDMNSGRIVSLSASPL